MVYAGFVSRYPPSFYGLVLQGGRNCGGQLWLQMRHVSSMANLRLNISTVFQQTPIPCPDQHSFSLHLDSARILCT